MTVFFHVFSKRAKNKHGLSHCVFACLENKYDAEILP